MIGMPATGIGMGLYSGKGLPFFWTTFSGFEKPNGKLAGQVCICQSLTIFKLIHIFICWILKLSLLNSELRHT